MCDFSTHTRARASTYLLDALQFVFRRTCEKHMTLPTVSEVAEHRQYLVRLLRNSDCQLFIIEQYHRVDADVCSESARESN